MKRKVLTDIELRTLFPAGADGKISVSSDTVITPAARDYISQHNIQLVTDTSDTSHELDHRGQSMTVTEIPSSGGSPNYVNALTGEKLNVKPEDMTHLHGNVLVPKNDSRIVFRGKLDTLMAEIISVQTEVLSEKDRMLRDNLDEILLFVRKVMAAEVREIPFGQVSLLGMDSERLRYVTHHLKSEMGIDHPVPDCRHGKIAAALNRLRTCAREAELSAVAAGENNGIIEALNRLSSCIYILFCRTVAENTGLRSVSPGTELEKIPVEVSARHVHLTAEAMDVLFGAGFRLRPVKMLSQPGEFLSGQRVTLVSGSKTMKNVAVLGPERKAVQVELSATDSRALGLNPPCRLSGDLAGSGGVEIQGPAGSLRIKEGVIIAKAHIHMTSEDGVLYGVHDGQRLSVRLETSRSVILEDVIARVKDKTKSALAMHIDFDEANAASAGTAAKAVIIKRW